MFRKVALAIAVLGAVAFGVVSILNVQTWRAGIDMQPTIRGNSELLIYSIGSTERGDIVVYDQFRPQYSWQRGAIGRVVGLPGETITFDNDRVHIDGIQIDESYLPADTPTGPAPEHQTEFLVPEDHFFILGDNRLSAYDSRILGPTPQDSIVANHISIRGHLDARTEWIEAGVFVITEDIAAGTSFEDIVAAGQIAQRNTFPAERPATFVNDYSAVTGASQFDIPVNSILVAGMFS